MEEKGTQEEIQFPRPEDPYQQKLFAQQSSLPQEPPE